MKALISTIESRVTGYRVAQVEEDTNIFPVAEPFFYWQTCPSYIIADQYWFDPETSEFLPYPPPREGA
jgi:hypothetical protein